MKKTLLCILFVVYTANSYSFEQGINLHIKHYNGDPQVYLNLAKQYGFTSVRDDYSWNLVQHDGKKFEMYGDLKKSDYFFSNKNDLSKMLILGYGNKYITKNNYPTQQEEIDAFSEYVKFTVKRYKGSVKYYEIWNEWLYGTGIPFRANPPDVKVFYKLVQKSSQIIRQYDPNAIIITGSINPLKDRERQWMDDLINMGVLNYIDGISLHPYSYGNPIQTLREPVNNLNEIDKYESYLKQKTDKEIPLYITEFGYTSYKGKNSVPPESIIKYLHIYMSEAKKRPYIKGVWWYDLIDDGTDPNNKEHHFGILNKNFQIK